MSHPEEPLKDALIKLEAARGELPLFPLPQIVLFPRALLPLHVFEPRYRALLRDCLSTHGALAIPLITNEEDVDEYGHPRIAEIAGAGVIVEHQLLADGRSNVLLYGCARVRLDELPFVPPYRRARATLIVEPSSAAVETNDRAALVAAATSFCAEIHKRDTNFSFQLPSNAKVDALADICAHHLVINAHTRQHILEQPDVVERVRMVTTELAMQHSALCADRENASN